MEDEESKHPGSMDPLEILEVLDKEEQLIQSTVIQIQNQQQQQQRDEFLEIRTREATKIRKDADLLKTDTAIARRQLTLLQKIYNAITLSGFILGIISSIYQIIAGIFIVLEQESNATLLERCIVIIPPTLLTGIVTVLFGIIRQVSLTEKMEKLAKTITDATYVISRLEPMIDEAQEADTLEKLDIVRNAYKGETSALKQKSNRALDDVLSEEERMVSVVTYRYYSLFRKDLIRRYEDILYMMINREKLNLTSEQLVQRVQEFGGAIQNTDIEPARMNPQESCAKLIACCKKIECPVCE